MAATSTAATNGVPAAGQVTTATDSGSGASASNNDNNNNASDAGNSNSSETVAASGNKGSSSSSKTKNNNNNNSNNSNNSNKPGGTKSAKRAGKEGGDQISGPAPEQRDQKDIDSTAKNEKPVSKNSGSSSNNNESSHNEEHNNQGDDSNNNGARRAPRKGGLSQELRERTKEKYRARTVNLLVRYNKLGSQFADFANNVAFLSRCANMAMIPKSHRVYNQEVRNTRIVVRILDQCCYKLLMADLDHNRRRKYQVRKNRERVQARLMEIMSPEDFEEIQKLCEENKEQHFNEMKEKQRKEFEELMEEYKNNS